MRKITKFALLFALVPVLFFTSCKKDEPAPNPSTQASFSTLKTYMTDNSMDLPALLSSWVVAPEPLSVEGGIVDTENGYTIPGFHVFDIRSVEAFAAGHIEGAMRVDLKDVVETAAGYTDKPILVACVTGQTAGHAVMALRLSGYADAKVLKWGMSGWNSAITTAWESNIGDIGLTSDNWIYDEAPAPGSFDNPSWSSSFTAGADILAERVDAMLNGGFKAVGASTVLSTPADYQIINFWDATDYTTFGHFSGAYQVKPISLADDISKVFDPASVSLVYCYTGQTSSMATAWLNVLGYNVSSVLFGVNALNYTELAAAGKPHWHGAYEYEFAIGE
jgi:rhodanese-related sulfurtransferase